MLLLGGWSQLSKLVVAYAWEQNQNNALQQTQRSDAEQERVPEPEHNVDFFINNVHWRIEERERVSRRTLEGRWC